MRGAYGFLIVLSFFCLLSHQGIAQQDSGRKPLKPGVFAQNLAETFDRYQTDRIQGILDAFLAKWEGEAFSNFEQRRVIKLVRSMEAENYRPSNGIKHYLQALTEAKNRGITEAQFRDWHNVLQKVLSERRDMNQLNEVLVTYFQSRALYKSRSKNWYTKSFQFDIGYHKEQPALYFKRPLKLFCATESDSIQIYNAKGRFHPVEQVWKGTQGKATWERVGLGANQVYAQLDAYSIRLSRGRVRDDSVAFFNKDIRQGPMEGSFKDKIFIAEQERDSRYPQFKSKQKRYKVNGFFPQVKYKGGFAMEGISVVGTSVKDQPARISIFRNGQEHIQALADRFVINKKKIVSNQTMAKIFFKKDSIYHTSAGFKYYDKEKEVRITKGDRGLEASPFYNSYHNLEVLVDKIVWNIKDPVLKMRMTLNSVRPAIFRSNNFFQKGLFHKVQGILEYNPLKEIKLYAERINSFRMKLKGLAGYLGINKANAKKMLVGLHKRGFVEYHRDGTFLVRDKLVHYVESKKALRDYDNIELQSNNPDSANAKLNLNNGDMQLSGVPEVNLSDSQRVSIYPADSQVTMQKNRDMTFEGEMIAGRFQFFGDGFSFNYDSFKVNMNNVDSLRLYYPNEQGRLIPVKNVIEDIYGSVYIDDPNNKSGQVDLPEYPIFDAKEESVVYYEDPNIYDSVYPADSFYFQIKPFVAENLDEFKRKEMQFDGTFYSAGILPVFDYHIRIMPNNSLGFKKRSPSDGYELYQGKGTGIMEITLSSKGLKGAGTVEYLPSTTESQNFVFFPDSMNAVAESFNIPEEGQDKYPPVTGDKIYNHWLPYKDSMFIKERDPLSVYNEEVTFEGDLVLTPAELYGAGEIKFEQAVIGSNALAMKPNSVDTDSASFKLKALEKNQKPNFYTPDASLTLDFDERILDGESQGEKANISFKQHNFRTSIKGFNWRIDSQSLSMTATKDQKLEDAFMQSTKAEQDSLKFNTTAAYFDLSKSTIEARNIPHIDVADAEVYPSDGAITIEEGADLETLENARIVADTNKEYHKFYDAQINIFGKKEYAAKGKYDYKDRNGQPHTIKFDNIRTNEEQKTIAEGKIGEEEGFPLSPRFRFNGKVKLKASRERLAYNGKLEPANSDSIYHTEAFQFRDTVNPDSIIVPVRNMKNPDGESLVSGIFIDTTTHQLYDVFLGQKHHPQDLALFKAKGYLHYNYYEGKYMIKKKRNMKKPDSMPYQLTYSDQNGEFSVRGPLQMNFGNNEYLDIKTIGKAVYNPKDSAHSFDVVMGMDFPFNKKALKIAADSLINLAFPLNDSRDGRQVVQDAAYYLIQDRQTQISVLSSLRSFGSFISNEVYRPNFLFTGVNLTWDPRQQAFLDTNKLGLATIHKTAVNKQLKGKLKFKLSRDEKRLQFYAGGTPGNYYYFNINNKGCKVIASDYYFNQKVKETADDVSEDEFQIKPLGNPREKIFFQQSATIRKPEPKDP